jgi:hypothetical protein
MKKILFVLMLAVVSSASAQWGKGKTFPDLEGETFDGKAVKIPADTKGKYSIIGMCFSKDAEGDLQTWLNPLYNTYVLKHEGDGALGVAATADVNFYLMPKFNLVNQITQGGSQHKIKEQTDKAFWPNLIFYVSGLKEYKKTLEITETAQPYIFVLDKDGKIVHVERGVCNDKKMSAIDDHIEAE